jgi:hypothetical protein
MNTPNIPAAVLAVLVTSVTLGTMGRIADVKHREVLAAAGRTSVVAKAAPAARGGTVERQARNASLKCQDAARCKSPS